MKFLKSFAYASKGLWLVVMTQRNMRVHLLILTLVTTAGYWFGITKIEWLIVILFYAMVLMAESFNTAIEKLTDLKSPEFNQKAGEVKDIAAAAVLITAMMAFIAGLIIFVPYLQKIFSWNS